MNDVKISIFIQLLFLLQILFMYKDTVAFNQLSICSCFYDFHVLLLYVNFMRFYFIKAT